MSHFAKTLKELQEQHLYRELRAIDGPQSTVITHSGRDFINFSSNDYLGLANHPKMGKASVSAAQQLGTGSGASRLITGSFQLHEELEIASADFKGTEAALLFNSGYTANLSALPALTREHDVIFSDELNHASLIDGCRLSPARKTIFPHANIEQLDELMKKEASIRKLGSKFWIVTDSLFSMDGDLAPLAQLSELATRYQAYLYIDDAHGTGVYGESGKGLVDSLGLDKANPQLIQLMTFSKALGSFGASLCASREIINLLINKARGFIYSTALPPAVVGANLKALELVPQMVPERKQLWDNVSLLKSVLQTIFKNDKNHRLAPSQSPILPIIFGNEELALASSRHLFDEGLWAQAIRPPTVLAGTSRIRLTVTSEHTRHQIGKLQTALENLELKIGL